ncbi:MULTISPECIES: N-acetyltransferase [unclassified Pseudomonas]|jgi:ribosomal protein S18 acetylase RimI-like enzyme|uniref:GNAT family N-acetyltransferase n=1 Tax=unclassified Pseudomonas TaxID=196821 RepID=UPI00096BBF17|nr:MULTISPECIES: GNAT family N-acetyltransferase [unclassified Pseudomonas]NWA91059.1 GNAT family N-acetyltransferase [Pseudomonas sp. D8002]OLY72487.1 hypothetical protein AU074_11380 [Pseudomonas sp. ATCC PTA-122608]PMU15908.1 N-acetyltransferase [Pseudomonas sp. GP01-A9]PMU22838.1 N-acetyltransferase [Pseudomonas sp. GP01-A13]PMU33361.1 N-acetyltransferase [Pseudomonas sp. GP01-A8]
MLPPELKDLIHIEQRLQKGEFIRGISAEDYILKIEDQAEILIHHSGGSYNGFVAFYCNNDVSREGYIALLLIAASGRGKGLGGELLSSALMVMKSRGFTACSLEVRAGNSSAIKLYTRYGFKIVADGDTNIKMQVRL